jgi:hypothetical protein
VSELHDMSDEAYWRSLTPRQVVDLVQAQLAESYADAIYAVAPTPESVIRDALQNVGEDVQDRAVDQYHCSKVDPCAGKAAFLNWLAWHLDARFYDCFIAEAAR